MRDYFYPGLDTLASQVRACIDEHGFTRPAVSNMSEKLMLTTDELSEAHEEIRSGMPHGLIYFLDKDSGKKYPLSPDMLQEFRNNPARYKPEGFAIEVVDAIIRELDILEGIEISVALALSLKMRYNETRPPLHGRKF